MPVTLFADFTCPFSYVTEARLRSLDAEVDRRAFERYPAGTPLPSTAEPLGWEDAVVPLADEAGIVLRRPRARPRTRKAHEAAYFAQDRGVGEAMRMALYAAYFADGQDIGRIDVLVELGTKVGLDRTELKVALDIDQCADVVFGDGAVARQLGIRNTPTLLLGSGPQARILTGPWSRPELAAIINA